MRSVARGGWAAQGVPFGGLTSLGLHHWPNGAVHCSAALDAGPAGLGAADAILRAGLYNVLVEEHGKGEPAQAHAEEHNDEQAHRGGGEGAGRGRKGRAGSSSAKAPFHSSSRRALAAAKEVRKAGKAMAVYRSTATYTQTHHLPSKLQVVPVVCSPLTPRSPLPACCLWPEGFLGESKSRPIFPPRECGGCHCECRRGQLERRYIDDAAFAAVAASGAAGGAVRTCARCAAAPPPPQCLLKSGCGGRLVAGCGGCVHPGARGGGLQRPQRGSRGHADVHWCRADGSSGGTERGSGWVNCLWQHCVRL